MTAVTADVESVVVGLEHVAMVPAAAVDAVAVDAAAAAAAAADDFQPVASPLNQDYPSRMGTHLCFIPENSPTPKVGFHSNS